MAQTPISVSTGIQGSTNTTVYTVPVGKTAIVKAVMAQPANTSSGNFTISKEVSGQNFPINYNQPSTFVAATGATGMTGANLISAPLTLAAGEKLKTYTTLQNYYNLPSVSTATSTTAVDGSTYNVTSLVFGNGIYMAGGSYGGGAYVATSTDAITWTQRTSASPFASTFNMLSCNGSVWVAAFVNDSQGKVFYSTDNGVTWGVAVFVAASHNVNVIINNGSTFLLSASNGKLYSSTNGSTWTENTAYNTITGSTFAAINNLSWSGSHWIVDNNYGALASADLNTWFGYVCTNLGRSQTSNFFYTTTYSPAYNKYYSTKAVASVPNVFSSSNGFLWEVLATLGSTPYKINCAGANTILIGVPTTSSSTTRYKSTDGSTFTATSDIGGYTGAVYGLANGYYLTMQNNGTNDACALSTDPTTSTGTTGLGGLGSFILYSAAADPVSGKWVGVGSNGTAIYAIGGTSGTNIGTTYNSGYTQAGGNGKPSSICWSPVDSYFYMVTDTGIIFRMTAHNTGWEQITSGLASGASETSIKAVGTTLYIVQNLAGSAVDSIYTSSTLTGGSGWTQYSYGSNNSNGYRGTGRVGRSGMYYGEALATNGTDLVWVNLYGYTFALTPSVSITGMRMPISAACGAVQTVNGNSFMYGSYYGLYYGPVLGYYTSTNVVTTYGTFVNTNANNYYWSDLNQIPNKINYVNGSYYVTSSGVNSLIWKGTTPTAIANNFAQVGSTIAGNVVVNPNQGWALDGTNLVAVPSSQQLNKVCKTTTPDNYLYSSTITASIVEIS